MARIPWKGSNLQQLILNTSVDDEGGGKPEGIWQTVFFNSAQRGLSSGHCSAPFKLQICKLIVQS